MFNCCYALCDWKKKILTERKKLNDLKHLLKSGADINAKNIYGRTALMNASENGHFKIVKFLVENDADPNVKNDRDPNWALRYASCNGHFKIVKFLFENGADPNLQDSCFVTQHSQIAIFLLEHGQSEPLSLWVNMETKEALNKRIDEIIEIRRAIKAVLFPNDEPVIAQIVGEFSDGLENLRNIQKKLLDGHNV